MAVVVDPKDVDEFMKYANEENLEAVVVAVVTEEPRLVLNWRGKEVVNISRAFLDTNGAHQETEVLVDIPNKEGNVLEREEKAPADTKAAWLSMLADLNTCSQKGLVEMFDGSIGAGSVFMPYGGKYQLTETQAMVAKVPVLNGKTDTVTMMSYGFDPYVSSWSPYHGAVYAVVESVARIVANGGDYSQDPFHLPGILPSNDRGSGTLESAICSAAWCICGTDGIWPSIYRWKGQYVRNLQRY